MGDPTSPQPNPMPPQPNPQPSPYPDATPHGVQAASPAQVHPAPSAQWGNAAAAYEEDEQPAMGFGGARLARTPIGKAAGAC